MIRLAALVILSRLQCIENPALGESARQNTPQERSAAQFARHQSSISKSGGEMIGNLSRHSGVERQSGPQCLPRKRAAMARRWRFIAAPYSLTAVASRRKAIANKRTAVVRRFRATLTCFSRRSDDFGETTASPLVCSLAGIQPQRNNSTNMVKIQTQNSAAALS